MIRFMFILPIMMLAVQAISYVISESAILSYVRALVLVIFIFIYFLNKKPKLDRVAIFMILFLAYTSVLSLNSTNLVSTISSYISIFVSMSFYIISYNTVKWFNDFKQSKRLMFWIPIIFILNATILSVFNIGESVYGSVNAVHAGGIHHNTIYTGVLVVILAFVLIKYSKNKPRDILLISGMCIVILISFRRTALGLLVICFIIYLIMERKKYAFNFIVPFIIIVCISYPLYDNYFYNVLDARGPSATTEMNIENQTRFREILSVHSKIFSFYDLKYSLFGKEYLNSPNTYSTPRYYFPITRVLHTDYALILHGSGLVGLFLYSLILLSILIKVIKYIRIFGCRDDVSILLMMLLSIIIVLTMTGSILSITFRTTLFIILGALMGVSDHKYVYAKK